MQTLNLHDVTNITISPPQSHNTSQWLTITIAHEETEFQINLFPKDNITILFEDSICWEIPFKTTK
jgi:hypothetical protein